MLKALDLPSSRLVHMCTTFLKMGN